MTSWYNPDGLKVTGGRNRGRDTNRANAVKSFANEGVIEIKFDLEGAARTEFSTDRDNDGTNDGFTTGDCYIPDQANILSCKVYMTDEAAAGGTALEVGTYTEAGAEIDINGLVTATNGAEANLGANAVVTGSGAQIGTSVTQKAYVAVKTTGTHTAGKGTVVIKYAYPRFV